MLIVVPRKRPIASDVSTDSVNIRTWKTTRDRTHYRAMGGKHALLGSMRRLAGEEGGRWRRSVEGNDDRGRVEGPRACSRSGERLGGRAPSCLEVVGAEGPRTVVGAEISGHNRQGGGLAHREIIPMLSRAEAEGRFFDSLYI